MAKSKNVVLAASTAVVLALTAVALIRPGAEQAQATAVEPQPITYVETADVTPQPQPAASFEVAALTPTAAPVVEPATVTHEVVDEAQIADDAAAVGMTSLDESSKVSN